MKDVEKMPIPSIHASLDVEKIKLEYLGRIKSNFEFLSFLVQCGINLDIINENAVKLNDFLDEWEHCKSCSDMNQCPFSNSHFIRVPVNEDGKLVFKYQYCSKYEKEVKRKAFIKINDYDVNTENIMMSDINFIEVRRALLGDLLKYLLSGKTEKSVFFISGKPRSGASYISNIYLNNFVTKWDKYGAFLNSYIRFLELNHAFFKNKEKFNELFTLYTSVDILILSKISSVYFSDFARDNILFPILSERTRKKLFTIITSEVSLTDFITSISGKTPASSIKGKQIKQLLDSDGKTFDISNSINIY